jgi:hypothetical protein
MTEIIQNPNGTFAVFDGNELISDGWKKREYAEASVGGRMTTQDETKCRKLEDFGLVADCNKYIEHLKLDSVINDGHRHLAKLWAKYGRETVTAKLKELFN